MYLDILKFITYSLLIVLISKYILVIALRKLAKTLRLKPRTAGNIAGISTSIPELLTITTSSARGLIGASIYNVLSSNIINTIQYFLTVVLNKNSKKLKNKAILIDIILVLLTILIPIIILRFDIKLNTFIVPLFIIMYLLFIFLNNNAHKNFLQDKEYENEKYKEQSNVKTIIKYTLILLITGILLYFISELLGQTLDNLCNMFSISQTIVGSLLGFITSIPELLTFFESQKHHKKIKNEMKGVVEATNNLFTSNILNLFIIQTIGIIIIK